MYRPYKTIPTEKNAKRQHISHVSVYPLGSRNSTKISRTETVTVTFNYNASLPNQTWIVPAGVVSVGVQLWGAGGQSNNPGTTPAGGIGGFVSGVLAATPGDTWFIHVGGHTGGGTGSGYYSAAGGDYSAIQTGTPLLVVAGGGSGNGGITINGAAGGGLVGATGDGGRGSPSYTTGGTQSAGGMINNATLFPGNAGTGPALYSTHTFGWVQTAGNSGGPDTVPLTFGMSGGGGGYYGGAGGGANAGGYAAGGGGSSYVAQLSSVTANTQGGGSASNTDGKVVITYTYTEV